MKSVSLRGVQKKKMCIPSKFCVSSPVWIKKKKLGWSNFYKSQVNILPCIINVGTPCNSFIDFKIYHKMFPNANAVFLQRRQLLSFTYLKFQNILTDGFQLLNKVSGVHCTERTRGKAIAQDGIVEIRRGVISRPIISVYHKMYMRILSKAEERTIWRDDRELCPALTQNCKQCLFPPAKVEKF